MRNRQSGIGFPAIFITGVVIALGAVGAMKIAPAYSEFMTVKKAVMAVAQSEGRGGNVAAMRKAFERRAGVDNIVAVTAGDLEITKEGGEDVISFAYSKKIPLFGNVSVCIDFAASTAPGGAKE